MEEKLLGFGIIIVIVALLALLFTTQGCVARHVGAPEIEEVSPWPTPTGKPTYSGNGY